MYIRYVTDSIYYDLKLMVLQTINKRRYIQIDGFKESTKEDKNKTEEGDKKYEDERNWKEYNVKPVKLGNSRWNFLRTGMPNYQKEFSAKRCLNQQYLNPMANFIAW